MRKRADPLQLGLQYQHNDRFPSEKLLMSDLLSEFRPHQQAEFANPGARQIVCCSYGACRAPRNGADRICEPDCPNGAGRISSPNICEPGSMPGAIKFATHFRSAHREILRAEDGIPMVHCITGRSRVAMRRRSPSPLRCVLPPRAPSGGSRARADASCWPPDGWTPVRS